MKKFELSGEWCKNAAELEKDMSITAGILDDSSTDEMSNYSPMGKELTIGFREGIKKHMAEEQRKYSIAIQYVDAFNLAYANDSYLTFKDAKSMIKSRMSNEDLEVQEIAVNLLLQKRFNGDGKTKFIQE